MQVLRRMVRSSPADLRLLAEATLELSAASLAIQLLPFRRHVRMGSVPVARISRSGAERCIWAVNAAAARLPWKTVCFQKGLALQRMLRKRGIAALLHYGIGKDADGGLMAHVWIEAEGRVIMGGAEACGFRHVATYPETKRS